MDIDKSLAGDPNCWFVTSKNYNGSAIRGDRSSALTQEFFAAKVGKERDGAAPKCKCGVYAILYLSKTSNNPNRLFFGFGHPHCNFFLWLDRHVAKIDKNEGASANSGQEEEDVNVHYETLNVNNRLGNLEDSAAATEKKKSMNMFLIGMGLIVVVLSICVSRV
ncbi:hypothetical protein PIB30_036904 [Stylosanthes scabra]|uniref:Zinc finger GRF-type domain-containing protein n=1 Tax=Stylosanthes scabra TaxID=79078 RepID=A0ABU6ZB65_9FABA|nr:hypothetical protein [Stylosanthes scabra]